MKGNAFETLKRAPAYRIVEEAVRKKILEGVIAPGDLLPSETDLAEQLGVTRPTVREAFRSLEATGLVERGSRRRMMVTAPPPRIVRAAMHDAIVLHRISFREIWELNMALEPEAAALAAANAEDAILDAIAENLRRTEEVLSDPGALAEVDVEFHDLVARASGNHALLLAREPLGELLFPAYGTVIRKVGPGARLLDAHQKVYEALRAGDVDVARDWMARHIRDFRRGCELAGLNFDEPVSTQPTSEEGEHHGA